MCFSYNSLLGNIQRANKLAGWESRDLCFLLSVKSLYNEGLLYLKFVQSAVHLRVRVRLRREDFMCNMWGV
jgi:hypothetical protein